MKSSSIYIKRIMILTLATLLVGFVISCDQTSTSIPTDSPSSFLDTFSSGTAIVGTDTTTIWEETTTTVLTTFTTITTPPIIDIEFDYLGNILPTNQIIRFEMTNANQTWFWNGPPVFSPNGTEVYWARIVSSWEETEIWYSQKINGLWTNGRKLVINGINGYSCCPVFTSNADEMYFMNVSLSGTRRIYKVTKIAGIWSNPQSLDISIPTGNDMEWRFSVADSKNIYISLISTSGLEQPKLYFIKYDNGEYNTPEYINALNQIGYSSSSPYIAVDESYIIFQSNRSSTWGHLDIFVSFKNGDGDFMTPINLGRQVNSTEEETSAIVSADGKYLFFTTVKTNDSFYAPYWIELDELPAFMYR